MNNFTFDFYKYKGVTIKYISFKDYLEIEKFINDTNISDRDFAINFLKQQLISPTELNETLDKLSDSKLKALISRLFIKGSEFFNKSFNIKAKQNLFKKLRFTIKSFYPNTNIPKIDLALGISLDTLSGLKKITESYKESINAFENVTKLAMFPSTNLASIIKDFAGVASTMEVALQPTINIVASVNSITEKLRDFSSVNFNALSNLSPDINSIAGIIGDSWKGYFKTNDLLKETYFKTLDFNIPSLYETVVKQLEISKNIFVNKATEYKGNIEIIEEKIGKVVYGSVDEFEELLIKIKDSIERHGIYGFWERKDVNLRIRPEQIAQDLLVTNLYTIIPNGKYILDAQPLISNGRIDIVIIFHNGIELKQIVIEIKIIKDADDPTIGIKQLERYLDLKRSNIGYRLLFNSTKKKLIEKVQEIGSKTIKDIVIDISPTSPSKL